MDDSKYSENDKKFIKKIWFAVAILTLILFAFLTGSIITAKAYQGGIEDCKTNLQTYKEYVTSSETIEPIVLDTNKSFDFNTNNTNIIQDNK